MIHDTKWDVLLLIAACVIFFSVASIVHAEDTRLFVLSPATVMPPSDSLPLGGRVPLLWKLYPEYVPISGKPAWIWCVGDGAALVRFVGPESLHIEDTYVRFYDREVSENETGLRLYDRSSTLCY